MTKYESDTQQVGRPVEAVYERFSNLRNLEALREKLQDPAVRCAIAQQVGEDKMEQVAEQFENVEFTEDSVTILSPIGRVTFQVVEREAPKLIKFELQGAPIAANLWIQLLPVDEASTKFRVTLGVELNMFMRAMVGNKLEKAPDGIAQMLAAAAQYE